MTLSPLLDVGFTFLVSSIKDETHTDLLYIYYQQNAAS